MLILLGLLKKKENEMTWVLFIDDERFPVDETNVIARSVEQAIALMDTNGCPHTIHFDHDLGDDVPTGMDLAKYIVEKDLDMNHQFIPQGFQFFIHSQNPQGERNIRGLLEPFLKMFHS